MLFFIDRRIQLRTLFVLAGQRYVSDANQVLVVDFALLVLGYHLDGLGFLRPNRDYHSST